MVIWSCDQNISLDNISIADKLWRKDAVCPYVAANMRKYLRLLLQTLMLLLALAMLTLYC